MNDQLDPGYILQTATAFWTSKVLLTAVEFDLFTHLGTEARTAAEIGQELGLHPRGRFDFLDALVAHDIGQRQRRAEAQTIAG